MTQPKLTYLHVLAITANARPADSGSPLELYSNYNDDPGYDVRTREYVADLNTGLRSVGTAFAVSLTLPNPCYLFRDVGLSIKGNDLWVPKTLALYVEDETGYVYPLAEFMNWPSRQATTWSTDPNEGKKDIQIYPLLLEG